MHKLTARGLALLSMMLLIACLTAAAHVRAGLFAWLLGQQGCAVQRHGTFLTDENWSFAPLPTLATQAPVGHCQAPLV